MIDAPSQRHNFRLSCVVIVHDMRREAKRTLASLAAGFQRHVDEDDYEVIVVENGSTDALDEAFVSSFGRNFRLLTMENPTHSPAPALNFGARAARGDIIVSMIDGARIVSPGCIAWTLRAFEAVERPAVIVPSWHLGPANQNETVRFGYRQKIEDDVLATVDWERDGYELFNLCEQLDPSSAGAAWFGCVAEANYIAVHRDVFEEIHGYEERFTSVGGGAVNLDFFKRVCEVAGCRVVSLCGEGTFHQFHGGVSTNVPAKFHPWAAINEEYRSIRGADFNRPEYEPVFLGSFSDQARKLLARTPNIFTHVHSDRLTGRYGAWLFKLLTIVVARIRPRRSP